MAFLRKQFRMGAPLAIALSGLVGVRFGFLLALPCALVGLVAFFAGAVTPYIIAEPLVRLLRCRCRSCLPTNWAMKHG
jgi:hypothetical protein